MAQVKPSSDTPRDNNETYKWCEQVPDMEIITVSARQI